jgi:transmembrane sensor
MEEDYKLAKWLADEMNETELADFEASADFDMYNKIKKHSSNLKTKSFDEKLMLENILSVNKEKPKVIPIYKNWIFKIAASIVLISGFTFLYKANVSTNKMTLSSQITEFYLPDNSQVTLNSVSEIDYKKWFWENNRTLELKGEAYFKVAKGKKFDVNTNLGKITVIGTQFNVKARENKLVVSCFEGKVLVSNKYDKKLITKGEFVVFENGKIVKNGIIVNQNPTWLNNEISFDSDNLQNVLLELRRQYSIEFICIETVSDKKFTGTLPTNDLDIASQIIAKTYNLDYKKEGKSKIIFAKK